MKTTKQTMANNLILNKILSQNIKDHHIQNPNNSIHKKDDFNS